MIERQEPNATGDEPSERIYRSERGRLVIREPAPNVLLYVEEGWLEAGFAPIITQALDAMVARGKPTVFVDCEGLDGYDPEIQSSATQWIRANRSKIVVQHMLVASRITRMGIAVVGLALGGAVKGHTSRAEFEALLADCLRKSPVRE